MNRLKQVFVSTGAVLLSASLFVLTLPLVLFMASAFFLTGIVGAMVLHYQLRKHAGSRPPAETDIIEGNYRSEPFG